MSHFAIGSGPRVDADCPFVSRGGLKLEHALREFDIDVRGLVCADFGCSTGGFTDCLLQRGAATVFAIDTAYGEFAWKLRNDARVVLLERTNALHAQPARRVDLVVADLGWTRQKLLIPAARKWLTPGGRVITLIKPHYERDSPGRAGVVLEEGEAALIAERVVGELKSLGAEVQGFTRSPLLGGARSGSKSKGTGNAEWLALVRWPEGA